MARPRVLVDTNVVSYIFRGSGLADIEGLHLLTEHLPLTVAEPTPAFGRSYLPRHFRWLESAA